MNILRFIIPKSLVQTLSADSTVRQASETMIYHRYTALPVLEADGRYLGTVRSDDLFRYYFERKHSKKDEQDNVMHAVDPHYLKPLPHDAPLERLMEEVVEHNFVPVVDDRGCFIGIILRREILGHLLKFYRERKDSHNQASQKIT